MGWSIGYDSHWERDIGYGVPAYCDHPGCKEEIDRGLAYVCGGEPYGGDRGCGLYFCGKHRRLYFVRSDGEMQYRELCKQCAPRRHKPFTPTPDCPDWIKHKLIDESWQQWRDENPDKVEALKEAIKKGVPCS